MSLLKRRWWVGLLLIFLAAPVFLRVSAQDTNLLQDAGFEGNYVGRGRPNLNTPAAWNIWLATSPHNYDWQTFADKVAAFPQNGGAEVHSGSHSLNLNDGYATFTAAIYQQVSVQPNQNYTGSIWARLKTCNSLKMPITAARRSSSGAYVKVGIDPTGGTDPNNPAIVWSGNIRRLNTWQQARQRHRDRRHGHAVRLRLSAVGDGHQRRLLRRRRADRRWSRWQAALGCAHLVPTVRPAAPPSWRLRSAPRRWVDCSRRPVRRHHDRHFVRLWRLH